jgi:hypothetical protein
MDAANPRSFSARNKSCVSTNGATPVSATKIATDCA